VPLVYVLLDAHIHLTDSEYSGYLQHVITSLRAMNIVACSVTVDIETSSKSFSLFNSCRDTVRQFVGIHPEAAAREDLEKFSELFQSNLQSVDGVGEIGLDKTYIEMGVPYDRQKQVFHKMLQLAELSKKPVSIHSRKSLDDILEILPSYKIKGALLHWFAGSKKQLAKSMDMGLFVSYGPALVYAEDKQVLLKNTNRDRFLIETDGPVRYSRCFEGMPAISTSFLVSVAAKAAGVLGMAYGEAVLQLESNARSYLGA
jgi:TatD DNase family protein